MMTNRIEATENILEVIPDILLWIDETGRLLDYHPNNHAFLFDKEGGVVGLSLEEIFNKDLSKQMLNMALDCRKKNYPQSGLITFKTEKSLSTFECRITPADESSYIAGWREIVQGEESEKTDLVKGNSQATLLLLTEHSLEEAIASSFSILGGVYHSDRIILFRNQRDPETGEIFMSLQQEWSHPDVASSIDCLQDTQIPYHPDLSIFYDMLNNDSPVIVITEDLTPNTKKFLHQLDIRSVVVMPVHVRNTFWGFLGIGDCRSARIWKEEEVSAIKAISLVLGAVIQKHQDQEELTIARLHAEESDRLKSSILANMNHELRTPMTGILGFSEILVEQLENQDSRQMAENILVSGRRLLATLNSMIELSQFEAKKNLFKLKETKLNELILLTCEPHITGARIKKLGFDIYMNESIFSFIDEKLFAQLLNYLLENAVKFTDKGKVTVETGNRWDLGKSWSCISITDTGPGIPSEYHELIFEEFRQVSEGYNRSFEGSGLGLTLSKKIVELMNGKITMMSREGEGSTFTIWLPSSQLSIPEIQPEIREQEYIPEITETTPINLQAGLPSILIVEDNRLNSELIRIYLRPKFNCDVAQDGETALEMVQKNSYDIILMDINLGTGIDGMETTRQIRKIPAFQQIPIIAVTGYTMDSDREEILAAGCSHYLPKPIDKKDLSALITTLVGKA